MKKLWTTILLPLTAGLCLFLFGMKIMELALHQWAGPHLKRWVEKGTKTPLRGLLAGTGFTALLQSSSAITVITIGMVNAGILSFPRTLGIILGTNIGTVVTTELLGMNITSWAVPLLLIFGSIWLLSWMFPIRYIQATQLRWLSLAVCGFACVLMGMMVMQSIVPALEQRGLFTWFVEQAQQNMWWGLIAGTLLTALIQSSAAAVAITMSLVAMQTISLDLGIAIVLGANIGTCVTGLIAALGGTSAGQFVALAHVLLNVGGALLFMPLIPLLEWISVSLSNAPASQVAHAQTVYNILCSLIALPLCYLPIKTSHLS